MNDMNGTERQEFERLLLNCKDALTDKRRFTGLVKDLLPGQPLQVNLLLMLYGMGIHEEMEKAPQLTNAFAFRFVKRLCDEHGVSRANADWAVSAWCVYYGKNVLKKPCEIKIGGTKPGGQPAIREETPGREPYRNLFRFRENADGHGCAVSGFTGKNYRILIFPDRCGNLPVTAIAEGAFSGSGIREAVMTDGITTIGAKAFSGCAQLKQIIFPGTLTEIGDFAFSSCAALAGTTLPARLERIGAYAFASAGIKSPVIPDSVYWIGEGAYSRCEGVTEAAIPKGVVVLRDKTFMDSAALKKVTLPEKLESIGAMAFAGCVNLMSLSVPDSVTFIGEDAFRGVHKKFVLICGMGSRAERYAREKKLNFQLQ